MARIRIASFCKASHVTRGDGAHLRREIESHLEDEDLVLDFAQVRIASVSFFDESMGLLAKKYPVDELARRVRVENMDRGDRALLNRIVLSRAKEREAEAARTAGPVRDALRTAGVAEEVLARWTGSLLALYPTRGAESADARVASKIARENVAKGAWTLDLGHYQMGLPRERAMALKHRLDELGVEYEQHSLVQKWFDEKRA